MSTRPHTRKKTIKRPSAQTKNTTLFSSCHEHAHERDILQALHERKYRVTAPRRKIIAALATAASPKTAKDIGRHTRIKDASTVYRTLRELVKEELLTEFQDRGVCYFEVAHAHHDHAVCDQCGAMSHVPCERPASPRALTQSGWQIATHEILYRGLCRACTPAH
jgi:Fe2+ or Zn2+ uptake regulation protein